jgi:hypothetical protein
MAKKRVNSDPRIQPIQAKKRLAHDFISIDRVFKKNLPRLREKR